MKRVILSLICFVIVFIAFVSEVFAINASSKHFDYIIDTDIGGDIDDVLALLVALNDKNKPIAITTAHIEPVEKAKIAKLIITELGYAEIPVYAGVGVTRDDLPDHFLKLNSLWPPFYGYPHPTENQKPWYEKQSSAYRNLYGAEFDFMPVNPEPAPSYIAKLAKNYSPAHPLIIIALGPLHNIDAALAIDDSIKDNLLIYSMGGDYPKGYNWLISPETTARVLEKVKTVCITSEFIEANQFWISPAEFDQLTKKVHSRLGRAILDDWKNWHKIDATHPKFTQLGDPVTMYLALHPEEIVLLNHKKIVFPCLNTAGELKDEFRGCWYSQDGLKNKIIHITDNIQGNIQFVSQIKTSTKIKSNIVKAFLVAGKHK